MKYLIKKIPWNFIRIIPLFILISLLEGKEANGQAIECASGTTMYGVFVDTLGSGTADSTEIRPINFTTGIIGALAGGRRYFIVRGGRYGASAMGVDGTTNRIYLMTQMAGAQPKDIIAIDPTAPTHAAAVTVIGTTPSSLNDYHFVKVAIAPPGPTGYGYAIGVLRDSTLSGYNALNYNPLIRFTTCVTANCTAITLLGYLPGTGNMYKTLLFNGDIAFDAGGSLYFATAAFERVGGIPRYTDSRLFRIRASDIPSSAGTGTIPMSFLADFNTLDSTILNGIAFNSMGDMYFSTRRFTGVQTNPPGHADSEVNIATNFGAAVPMPGFNTTLTMPDKSISDLGSCYFPFGVLSANKLQLSGNSDPGKINLKWQVNNNNMVNYYEIQKSADGTNFTTITTINTENAAQSSAVYQYAVEQNQFDKAEYYRIRQSMKSGMRFYSNVIHFDYNNSIQITGSLSPNPFVDNFNFVVQLKSPKVVNVRLADQNGRIVCNKQYNGKTGENKFKVIDLAGLRRGIYFVEISTENEVIREKVIKQ